MEDIIRYYGMASGELLPFSLEKDGRYINQTDDVDAIMGRIKDGFVSSAFRIFVLYPDETIAYQIPTEDIKTGGSYNENYQNGQRRSLSFTLYDEDGKYTPGINRMWAGTRLRLDLGVELSGGETIWCQKGIYVVSKATPSISSSGREVAISAGDKYSLFENASGKIDSTYEIPVGTEIEGLIRDTLLTEMGNGGPFDPKPFIYHSSFKGKRTQATITKSAGDALGGILSEIATQLSAETFYNAAGNLVVVPTSEVTSDGDKPLICELSSDAGEIEGLSFDLNYDEIVNRIIVVGGGVDGGSCRAEAQNDDAASPLCVQRIGRRTGDVVNDSNITSQVLAQERADYELRQKLILKSTSSVTASFNPFLEVNNLVAISDSFFGLDHERFLIQSVSCSLDYGGQMSLSFTNLGNLPFTAR